MVYIGIDPGLTGAVAIIRPTHVEVFETPTAYIHRNGKLKSDYLVPAMAAIVRTAKNEEATAAIEYVAARPGQGVTSMFSFGRGMGIWLGVLGTLVVPYTQVTPVGWKKHFGLVGQPKDASRLMASMLFPEINLSRKKDVGKADALLIAKYLYDKEEGK